MTRSLFTVIESQRIASSTMTSQTEKAKAKLLTLSSSFDDLEDLLEPLFAQTLPETILGLEKIQQAKLQTVLPYLVYDLVFSVLKSYHFKSKL